MKFEQISKEALKLLLRNEWTKSFIGQHVLKEGLETGRNFLCPENCLFEGDIMKEV